MLYPCMLCVSLLMCLLCVACLTVFVIFLVKQLAMCLTVFVNFLVKQLAMFLGVVAIFLLNVMDVFSVCGGALLDRPLWSSKECVCCVCDPNEHLSAPSICFVCVFVYRKLSLHLGV